MGTDLRIPISSTLRNAGVSIGSVTDDIDGDTRPKGSAYEIGCDEIADPTPTVSVTGQSVTADMIATQ